MKKYKAIALFSGGLDSILAVLWMQKIGVEVIPVFFKTPFFGPSKALTTAADADVEIKIVDITDEHIEMLKKPKYGYGKNFNPCIDCHGLMFKKAAELLKEWNADFLISGEVLGQRPMSQRKDAMNSVGKLSGVKDLLIRPLSQKLLKDSLPITAGWIKKEDLLDIQGRTRSRQFELAKEFGITKFPDPGGGCRLTDKNYSLRLKDLFENDMFDKRFISFLKYGRHFRIANDFKLIMGKTSKDNTKLTDLCENEIVLKVSEYPGPIGFLNFKGELDIEKLKIAASILLRYCNKAPDTAKVSYGKKFKLFNNVEVTKLFDYEVDKYQIKL